MIASGRWCATSCAMIERIMEQFAPSVSGLVDVAKTVLRKHKAGHPGATTKYWEIYYGLLLF